MITYDDARAGAEYARAEWESGDSTSTINYQLTLKYPLANGFERNRMMFRGVTLFNIQSAIRAGAPPFSLIVPFPTPPSTGPSSRANEIRLVVRVVIETTAMPDKYRNIVADGVSGNNYSVFLLQVNAVIAFWMLVYPGSTVTVVDPALFVY